VACGDEVPFQTADNAVTLFDSQGSVDTGQSINFIATSDENWQLANSDQSTVYRLDADDSQVVQALVTDGALQVSCQPMTVSLDGLGEADDVALTGHRGCHREKRHCRERRVFRRDRHHSYGHGCCEQPACAEPVGCGCVEQPACGCAETVIQEQPAPVVYEQQPVVQDQQPVIIEGDCGCAQPEPCYAESACGCESSHGHGHHGRRGLFGRWRH
jgi:hypothetical protein